MDVMDSITPNKGNYHAYLLRFWSEPGRETRPVWRFVLLDTQTRRLHAFQSLEALCVFLAGLTGADNAPGDGPEA